MNNFYLNMIEKLEEENYCLSTILNSINEGVLLVDKDGIIRFYNSQIRKFEGLDPKHVLNNSTTSVYKVDENNSEHSIVQRTGRPIIDRYQRYITIDNKEINLIASTYPIMRDGKVISSYSISRNLVTIKELYEKTEKLEKTNNSLYASLVSSEINNNTRYTLTNIIYKSKIMKNLIDIICKASENMASVLIYGETGTGKEIFVQGLHNSNTITRNNPFIGINCAAIPDNLLESLLFGTVSGSFTGATNTCGLFEQAGHGTLYLDEINSMPLVLQSKLLRVLQEKKYRKVGATRELNVNCRIVSSTNINPLECIKNKTLRNDLFYRLSVISLEIPPLRKRSEDIPLLIEHFIDLYSKKYGKSNIQVSTEYLNILCGYQFEGNVRELEHIIESSVSLVDSNTTLIQNHLPGYINSNRNNNIFIYDNKQDANITKSLAEVLIETEKNTICDTLKRNNWNVSKSAQDLCISRQNLQYRIKKLGLVRSI